MSSHPVDRLAVTHKTVFMIAVPMGLGYLTTPLVGIADTAIVGQIGDAALIGGVAITAAFIGMLLTTFNFLRFATSAQTAQAFGAHNQAMVVGVLLRSSLMAVIAGALVIILNPLILYLGLMIMSPSDAVGEAASIYFKVRVFATPFTLLNYVFLAWLAGTNRPVMSFALQTVLNIVNVIVSYYLVIHLEMGIAGAAWGTVIAEVFTVFLTLFFLAHPVQAYIRQWRQMMFDLAKIKTMMLLNADIMVRSFCLFAAFAFFTRQSAQQSDEILAANEILLHFFMVAGYFLDGFAIAAEQFVGRAVGAKSRRTFERAVQLTGFWNLMQALALSGVFYISCFAMIDFMTVNEAVRDVAKEFYLWTVFTPVIGVLAFQMDGVFIGATWSRDMRNAMLVSLALLIIAYYALFPLFDNHGLWLALWIFLGMRGVSLYWLLSKRRDETFSLAAR